MIGKINIIHIFSISLFFVLLVAGCTATPAPATLPVEKAGTTVATQEATVQPTVTPKPSETRFPTDTPTPTSEPSVPLSADGPWLVYLRSESYNIAKLESEPTTFLYVREPGLISHSLTVIHAPEPGHAAQWPSYEEFGIMNQDGSGRVVITWPECAENVNAFLMAGENATSYMVDTWRGIYIFRPSHATGMLVYQNSWELGCHTNFIGDEKSGLLTSFYQPAQDTSPELVIYELPSGKIRNRFPLVKCPAQAKDCERDSSLLNYLSLQKPAWSPNGRYLAFAALLDATSSDLYIYDKQNDSVRRLTSGPDWVGPIEWSPDGRQIIMGEIPNDGEHPFAPSGAASMWSVSVSNNEIKLLGSRNPWNHHILRWLDDKRFVDLDGDIYGDIGAPGQGENLRLVDTDSGETRMLFAGSFWGAEFDPIHEIFAINAINTPEYPQGIYLVSMKEPRRKRTGYLSAKSENSFSILIHAAERRGIRPSTVIIKSSTVRYLEGPPFGFSFPDWDKRTGLFVSEDDCENDPQSFQAFDYLGNFTCVPKPTPEPKPVETHPYPAPNGKWTVFLKDGVWLESQGKAAIQVSPEKAVNIIWCPDSSCFFFSGPRQNEQLWDLYRVSLPDLTVKVVDEWTGPLQGNIFVSYAPYFQWLGVTK